MSSKFVGYGLKAIKNLIKGGKQKTTGTEVVQPFKFKPAKNKLEKTVKDLQIATAKESGKIKKYIQDMESEIEPFRRKLRQTTQKIEKAFGVKKKKKKKSFPDLNKDGKVTFADVLKGRGVKARA